MESLAQRFTHAVQWNVGVSVMTVIAQLGVAAILARLLTPSDFGLFAMASVAVGIARLLGERGLVSAMVREPVLDRKIMGSTVVLSCFLSATLAAIGFSIAPLAGLGSAIDERNLAVGLFQLMSAAILISGISAPAQAIMQRELRFRELGFLQFAGIILGTGGTTIIFALWGAGPWSLAYGNIANVVIISAGCWWKVRDRWSTSWHHPYIKRVGLVSVQMTLLRVLDGLWTQLPLIIAYAQLSPFDVGLYERSQTMVDMGMQSTTGRVSSVLFPVVASRQDHIAFLREFTPAAIGLYAIFLLAVTAFVSVMASDIVALVLGPNWHGAAQPLILVMIAFTSLMVSQPASIQLEAQAVFKPRIISAGFGAAAMALGSLALVREYGLIGIGTAAAISGAGTSLINIGVIVKQLDVSIKSIITWLLAGIFIALVLAVILIGCYQLLDHRIAYPAARVACMAILGLLTFVFAFRVVIGEGKRRVLSHYVSLGMSTPILLIARILGLRANTTAYY